MVCNQVNRCDDPYVYRRMEMRGVGALISIFTIIEFGIESAISNTFSTSPVASGWWTCAFFIAAGTSALSSNNKGLVIVACISSSIAILAGLTGSVTEGAVAKVFDTILSCGTYKNYPPTVTFSDPAFASTVSLYGAKSSYNTTSWCLYEASLLKKYDTGSTCYCSYDTRPQPRSNPTYIDSCEELKFARGGAQCDKIFVSFTPTLKASAGITALLTVLAFILSILTCIALCCEQRLEELPVIPAQAHRPGAAIQIVPPGGGGIPLGPGGLPYGVGGGAGQWVVAGGAGGPGEAKMAQAYYIDSQGQLVGSGGGGGGSAGVGAVTATAATGAYPTVVAHAQPVGPGTYALPPQRANQVDVEQQQQEQQQQQRR